MPSSPCVPFTICNLHKATQPPRRIQIYVISIKDFQGDKGIIMAVGLIKDEMIYSSTWQ